MIGMRKESGEITSDREEILKICTDSYSAHTEKYNEIKFRHRINPRVYRRRRSGEGHYKDE